MKTGAANEASVLAGAADFSIVHRIAPRPLAGMVTRLTGYQELTPGYFRQSEAASLVIPLVISFGTPFAIGLGRAPTSEETHGSFAAGLYAGPVVIDSHGAAACIQIDFTPLGAARFFGLPMSELANRMVSLDDLADREINALRRKLGELNSWNSRLDLAERFLLERFARAPAPDPAIGWAYGRLLATDGAARIGKIAEKLDWSRKHLVQRFHREVGLTPKTVARLIRFNRALNAAQNGATEWAGIAADYGYADQAHLTREFSEFAGITPAAWRARAA